MSYEFDIINLFEDSDQNEHIALIVEDEKVNQNFVRAALEKAGFECLVAESVDEALNAIAELKDNKKFLDVIC